MIDFGSLKIKEGESIFDFSKRFNKMYNKIPAEIKLIEAFAKITYDGSFNPDLFLLLRERRDTSSANMQYATLEVESNVLTVNRLVSKSDRDKGRGRSEASTFGSSIAYPQVDELTNMVKSLSTKMEKMKMEGKPTYKIFKMLTIEET
jgi:hypothetical protein